MSGYYVGQYVPVGGRWPRWPRGSPRCCGSGVFGSDGRHPDADVAGLVGVAGDGGIASGGFGRRGRRGLCVAASPSDTDA